MDKIKEIDGLRAIAILLVVFWHYVGASAEAGPNAILWRLSIFGRSGVDLFFVLSGYLIAGILIRNKDASHFFSTFYARRAFRILPIYYVMFGLFLIGKAFHVSPVLFDGPVPTWTYVAGLQNVWMTIERTYGAAWLGETWSLAIEEQFYLIFPAIVWCVSQERLRSILITLLVLCPILRVGAYLYGEPLRSSGYYFLTPFRADNLAIGALIAWYECSGEITDHIRLLARRVLIVTACLFPVYAILIGKHTDVHMGLWGHTYLVLFYGSALFYVLQNKGAAHLSFLRSAATEFFARISYALYLTHMCVILTLALSFGLSRDLLTWSGLPLALLAFAISVGLCWLSYKWLEAPLIAMAHRRFRYERPASAIG